MTKLVTINDSTSNIHEHCGVVTARGAQGNSALLEVSVSGKTYIIHNCLTREVNPVDALRMFAAMCRNMNIKNRHEWEVRESYEHALVKCLVPVPTAIDDREDPCFDDEDDDHDWRNDR